MQSVGSSEAIIKHCWSRRICVANIAKCQKQDCREMTPLKVMTSTSTCLFVPLTHNLLLTVARQHKANNKAFNFSILTLYNVISGSNQIGHLIANRQLNESLLFPPPFRLRSNQWLVVQIRSSVRLVDAGQFHYLADSRIFVISSNLLS